MIRGPNGRVPRVTDVPSGVADVDSTPPATTTSHAPAITAWAAKWTACSDDAHWRSTVTPGTESGHPAARTALRATFIACSPYWVTQPRTTSSTTAWSRSLRRARAASTSAARSVGCQPARRPLRAPMAVRTASTITAVVIGPTLAHGRYPRRLGGTRHGAVAGRRGDAGHRGARRGVRLLRGRPRGLGRGHVGPDGAGLQPA